MKLEGIYFILSLGALVSAQDDSDCDPQNDNNNDATCTGVVASSTVNVPVLTFSSTTTDIGFSTTIHPVYTTAVATTTDVGVGLSRTTIAMTTDIGTTPTSTNVYYGTTTDIGLAAPFYYTTDDSGSRYITYSGTLNPSQMSQESAYLATTTTTKTMTPSTDGAGPMYTAAPMIAAAAGLAALVL